MPLSPELIDQITKVVAGRAAEVGAKPIHAVDEGVLSGLTKGLLDMTPEEAATVGVHSLRDATDVLDSKFITESMKTPGMTPYRPFELKTIDATLNNHDVLNRWLGGFEKVDSGALDAFKKDRHQQELVNDIFGQVRNGTLQDVDLTQFGLKPEYEGIVKAMDFGLGDAPQTLGFRPMLGYDFKKAAFKPEEALPSMHEMESAQFVKEHPELEYLANTIKYHRDSDALVLPEDANIVDTYIGHMKQLARQYAATGKLSEKEVTVKLPGGGEQTRRTYVPENPDNLWASLQTVARHEDSTLAEKEAANFMLDNIRGKANARSRVDKAVNKALGNYVRGIMTWRVSGALKNYPTIAAQTNIPFQHLAQAFIDATPFRESAKAPYIEQILKRFGADPQRDLELWTLGQLDHRKPGFDPYTMIEKHSRDMTVLGALYDAMDRSGGRLTLENIANADLKTNVEARQALEYAFQQIKRSQGGWSSLSGRVVTRNPLGRAGLMFKSQKLTELEQLVRMAKEKDHVQMSRYLMTKMGLFGFGGALISPAIAGAVLASAPGMLPPDVQMLFEDIRDNTNKQGLWSTGAVGYAQQLLEDTAGINFSLVNSLAAPLTDTQDLPFIGQLQTPMETIGNAVGTFQNPESEGVDRVKAAADVANLGLNYLPLTRSVGGVQVSPSSAGRVAQAAAGLTQPGGVEVYKNQALEIDPLSEVARVMLTGNVDKVRARAYSDDLTGMKDVARDIIFNGDDSGQKTHNLASAVDQFVEDNYAALADKFQTTNSDALKQHVYKSLEQSAVTESGAPKPKDNELGPVIDLIKYAQRKQMEGDSRAIEVLKPRIEEAIGRLKERYPGFSEQQIMERLAG